MKILVVEGNTQQTRSEREAFGIQPYFEMFRGLLYRINPQAKIDTVFPADGSHELPDRQKLKSYDGIMYTGSSLSVLDNQPEVQNQLNFTESIFASGTPLYGSCWGLQVATVVAGGQVGKGDKGLELGITQPIKLTEAGAKSNFFKNRTLPFQALCIHYDEVIKTPKNTKILAYNRHSKIQAMTFRHQNSTFFGVQYHPEFKAFQMALITSFLSDKLIDNNHFKSSKEALELVATLNDPSQIAQEIRDYKIHSQEIAAWINTI